MRPRLRENRQYVVVDVTEQGKPEIVAGPFTKPSRLKRVKDAAAAIFLLWLVGAAGWALGTGTVG